MRLLPPAVLTLKPLSPYGATRNGSQKKRRFRGRLHSLPGERDLPVGWGSPVFDRIEADLAKAMLVLPATKGFEVGSGFQGTYLKGSEHNDLFENADGQVRTKSNRSGGVQGGISNGEELYFRVAFKPTATVLKPQQTVDEEGQQHRTDGSRSSRPHAFSRGPCPSWRR